MIDEIGKLELRGEGLAPACWDLIKQRQAAKQRLLLVVRDSLTEAVFARLDQQ